MNSRTLLYCIFFHNFTIDQQKTSAKVCRSIILLLISFEFKYENCIESNYKISISNTQGCHSKAEKNSGFF